MANPPLSLEDFCSRNGSNAPFYVQEKFYRYFNELDPQFHVLRNVMYFQYLIANHSALEQRLTTSITRAISSIPEENRNALTISAAMGDYKEKYKGRYKELGELDLEKDIHQAYWIMYQFAPGFL